MTGYLEKNFKHTFELQKIEISKEYQKINIRRNLSYYRVENNINEWNRRILKKLITS